MILQDVRRRLKTMEGATASQLAAELSAGRSEVEAALDFWIRRGDVTRCEDSSSPACGTSCTRCPIGSLPKASSARRRSAPSPVVYEWVSN
ncbi:MAG: FeoC-like transcriptional regulator [Spirochaetota bacterium]